MNQKVKTNMSPLRKIPKYRKSFFFFVDCIRSIHANLFNLATEKIILGIDPGFRSGCKVVCLDEKGDLLYNETIYPHQPQNESAMAMKKIRSMVKHHHSRHLLKLHKQNLKIIVI